jgi:lysophospholipase L1-like esterase
LTGGVRSQGLAAHSAGRVRFGKATIADRCVVRDVKSGVRILSILLAGGLVSLAQEPARPVQAPDALLAPKDLNQLCQRAIQLMEAGGISVPDLHNPVAPLIENARQSCIQLQARPAASAPTYVLLMNLRAFNALADSVPKPFPFPETARRQFAELRDDGARLDTHFRALLDSKEAQLVTPDRDELDRYTDANRKVQPADPKNPRVVFLGDAITDDWRLNEYFPDRDFINRGISDQISSQLLVRLKSDVIDLHPEAVVIEAGTADLARGIPLTTIENNYLMMADLAGQYRIKVIFASVLPVSDYHKDENAAYERTKERPPVLINALNEWIDRFCAQRGYTFLDFSAALSDNFGRLKPDFSDDGVHPNSKGYRIMAPIALQVIQKAVKPPPLPVAPAKPAKRGSTSNN